MKRIKMTVERKKKNMVRLNNEKCIIGFDDGYQLGKTTNFVFDNGVYFLGTAEPTLKENSLFYDGEHFKVGEGRSAITEDNISDNSARLRTMTGIVMEFRKAVMCRADVVYVRNGFPVESKSITIEKVIVKWLKEIQRDMKVQTGKGIVEHEVMKVLLKEKSNHPFVYAELIHGMMREKIHSLELELAESGYAMDYTNIIYVGNGELMARDHAGKYWSHTVYDYDLCANAKGYEFLAKQMMGKKVE